MSRSITWLQEVAHGTAVAKGWWDEDRGIPECLALIHSEVSEALEDYRDGHMELKTEVSLTNKPYGFPSELADIVIRCLDLAGHLGIDLEQAIEVKMAYNATRPHRHGGKRA